MAQTTDDRTYVSFPIVKFDELPDGNLLVYGKATDGSVDSDEQIVDPGWSAKALTDWMSTGPNVRVQHNPKLYPAGTGQTVEIDRDGDGGHWVKSLVVEPTAKDLVRHKALRAYSIGISRPVIERDVTGKARGGVIKGGEVFEISLVDRPANRNCGITLVKGAGSGGDWTHGDLEELLREAQDEALKGTVPEPDDAADDGPQEDEDLAPEHAAASKAWAAREPMIDGAPESGTEFLAKRAAWQHWQAEGEAGGLDGAEGAYGRWLAKRDMDPNVGGGVDRDELTAGDFVFGDKREFPVVTPGDVADAVSSWGRYKGTKTFEEFKSALTALAKRKGPEFESQLPAGWAGKTALAEVEKAAKPCPNTDCGAEYHADSKLRRCEKCGSKLPKAKKMKSERGLPADVQPAGEHREPDGTTTVEPLEQDAGMATDADPVADKIPASVKTADYPVRRMHDATCAAYHWDQVVAEYPSLKGVPDAITAEWFRGEVSGAVAKGDMALVVELASLAQTADELAKGTGGVELLADARALAHKAFGDMYPNVSVSPTDITPGQFQRPYLAAGHIPATGGHAPSVPASSHVPSAGDFNRGPLTAGHEDPSPESKANPISSVASGSARTYYTNVSREAARNAMQALHDHLSAVFPDMCPMAASKSVLPPNMGDTNRPTAVHPAAPAAAPGEKAHKAKKAKKQRNDADGSDIAALIKSTVAGQLDELKATYETQITALKAENAGLAAENDRLGAMPDPAQAPLRGVVRTKATTSEPAPVAKRSLVEEAQAHAADEQVQYLGYLQMLAKSADPALREQAETQLERLLATS